MEKPLLDFIDWWNNILWLVECLLDIYCDVIDLYYVNLDIESTVSDGILLQFLEKDT